MQVSTIFSKASKNVGKRVKLLEECKELTPSAIIGQVANNAVVNIYNSLVGEAIAAFESTEEFSGEEFTVNFIEKLEGLPREKLIKITILEKGKDYNIHIDIPLDQLIGGLDEYAQGVQFERDSIEEEHPRKKDKDPIKASKAWKHIYKAHGYSYTHAISLRMQKWNELDSAPYWYMVENGSPQLLSSSIGGFPTPSKSKPQHFLSKVKKQAIIELKNALGDIKEETYTRIKTEVGQVDSIINDIAHLKELAESIEEPAIVGELRIGNELYKAYRTGTGKFGLAKRPRVGGVTLRTQI